MEVMNWVVEMVLRCTLHAGQEGLSWEKLLSTVEFVINNSPIATTGYTTFFLNYGFYPYTTVDLIHDPRPHNVEWVNQFVDWMKSNFSIASKFLQWTQDCVKVQADQKYREQKFSGGDQVLLSTKHLNMKHATIRKLKKRFVGPFFVVRQVGPVGYELEVPEQWNIHNIFHVSLLGLFRTFTWMQPTTPGQPEELEPKENELYQVKKLLLWRWTGTNTGRRQEYLVLWKDYSLDNGSLTPTENFTYPEEL